MKVTLATAMAVCMLQCVIAPQAKASHAMGADISYQCLGGDSFLVRLNFYRDCGGILPSTTADINLASVTCGYNAIYTLPLVTNTPSGNNPDTLDNKICDSLAASSTCHNGGTIPGVEIWAYEDVIHLPLQCADWVISFSLCCRNDSVTNLLNPGSYDLYVEAKLNNTNGLCNNSPVFTSDPVPYRCLLPATYNHGVVDPDGDSLAFTLINPLSAGTPIPYASHNPAFTP